MASSSAPGWSTQDTLTVTVTVSLDFDAVGNDVQYGSVGFDLALKLAGSGDDAGNGTTTSGDSQGHGGATNSAGSPGAPEVAGVDRELPSGDAEDHGDPAGADNILVLGESQSSLPNTGVPVAPMLALGAGVLLGGLGLRWPARRRGA